MLDPRIIQDIENIQKIDPASLTREELISEFEKASKFGAHMLQSTLAVLLSIESSGAGKDFKMGMYYAMNQLVEAFSDWKIPED